MAIISTFLCWSNTRTGSGFCGCYTLIMSVICLAFYMLRYIAVDEMEDSVELKGIVYTGFILYSFLIGVSLVLLPGVYMDKKFLLLPWIYVIVITVLYETGAVALTTTVHLEQDHTLHAWEVVGVVFYCARLIANCYCFACVVSQYQELSEGRGTFDFLFKPRSRHTAGSAHLPESEEYNPPYGATLPPYSEENPYKEFSPPNYENLVQGFGDISALATSYRHEATVMSGRMSNDASFFHLSNATVNLPQSDNESDAEAYYERNECCEDVESNYSSFGSSDENSDYSNSRGLSSLSGFAPQQTPNNQYSIYVDHLKGNNFSNEDSVAMTCSSACLMGYSVDSGSKTCKKPSRSKRAQVSPISLQKRTCITWI